MTDLNHHKGSMSINNNSAEITDLENDDQSIKRSESYRKKSEVAQMFNGRSVFITGASGFIGRVLMEKLLRCYIGIKRIYILMRSKKNESPEDRLHTHVLNVPLFDKIRSMEANGLNLLNKIVVIPGNIGERQLGISDKDMQMLLEDENLSIIFHVAATVRFNETLKVAVTHNLIATKTIIDFARRLKNLVSFCHVSTAYVNSNLPEEVIIEEKLYPINLTPHQMICTAEQLDNETMQHLETYLVDKEPNTYTYTKALAEHLIAIDAVDLPVAIVRPSIVIGSWKEPIAGWIDNLNGPTGMLVAINKGLLRSMHVRTDCRADMIPVDVTVNTMIASAYYAAKINRKLCAANGNPIKRAFEEGSMTRQVNGNSNNCTMHKIEGGYCPDKHPLIFHANIGICNAMKWGVLQERFSPVVKFYPSVEIYRYPFGTFKNNKYHDLITRLFVHYLPALILDGILTLMGKKRRMLWIYGKLDRAVAAMSRFTTHDYKFQSKNRKLLEDILNEHDRQELFMDMENLDWKEFWIGYILGIRRYVLKESDDTLELARRNASRAYMIEMVLRAIIVMILGLCVALCLGLINTNDTQ